jgi:spermidine synthase
MSASVVIFYAFQILVGYVYDWIGVLTAAFLAGIAVGGAVATRRVKSGEGLVGAETLATAAPLAVAAVLTWLFSSGQAPAHARYIVLAAALLSGFATGYEFPVAVGVLRAKNASAGDAASRMQFLDQAGACLGACVTGILLVPSLGIMWTLAVLSVVKCFSLIAVIAAGRRQPFLRQD